MSVWYKETQADKPAIISSRIRLARNVKGIPFPKRMNDTQKTEFLESVKNILDGAFLEGIGNLKFFNLSDIPEEEQAAMVERHIISPDFAQKSGPRGLVISQDETLSIMLLEEDHIRIQALFGGAQLDAAFSVATKAEELISKELNIAFDEQLGYLTECPTNLGTGLRASVMLHLPVMESAGQVTGLTDSVSKIGLTVRGMYGEGSGSRGALYQLSNQVTLGISEKAAIENLKGITNQIIEREMTLRTQMDSVATEDSVYRALGILKFARSLSSEEMMKLISRVKLGVSMGILKGVDPAVPMTVLVETQAATLQKNYGRMTPKDRDVLRAKIIRELFSQSV